MIACLLLLPALLTAGPGEDALAFVRGSHGLDQQVMLFEPEGGAIRPLGPGRGDGAPHWSPGGDTLAFSSRTDRGQSIFTCDPGTGALQERSLTYPWNADPVWSPDGGLLAYLGNAGPDDPESVLVILSTVTGEESRWSGAAGVVSPAWMPNEKLLLALDPDQQLSFEGVDMIAARDDWHRHGALLAACIVPGAARFSTEIYLITQTQALPILPIVVPDSDRYAEFMPLPNPQGDRVAYESNDGGDREIFVLGRRGVVNVTNHRAADWRPRWSRDGKTLAFESFRGGRRGVYRVFTDTALVQPLAVSSAYDCWAPEWSADSRHVVYVSDQDGRPGIYQCTEEGADHARLVPPPPAPAWDLHPQWRPR